MTKLIFNTTSSIKKDARHFICGLSVILMGWATQAQDLDYVVEPGHDYWHISSYSEGLAKVEIGTDSVGFIDRSGDLLFKLDYRYSNTGNFHNDRAGFKTRTDDGYKFGFINKQGEVVIPPRYNGFHNFSTNRAIVKKGNDWQVIDTTGATVINDSLILKNAHGEEAKHRSATFSSFHNGLMKTRVNGQYGYIDKEGEFVVPPQYDVAKNFSGNVALVADSAQTPQNEQQQDLIRRLQERLGIDSLNLSLEDLDENELLQSEDSLLNAIAETDSTRFNGDKRELKMALTALLWDMQESRRQSNKWDWKIINEKGEEIYHFDCDQRPAWRDNFNEGMLGFYKDRKMGFVNAKGNVVVSPQYGNSPFPLPYADGVTIVQVSGEKSDNSDGYMKLIDMTGQVVTEKIPFKTDYGLIYDSKKGYHEGLLAVKVLVPKKGNRWGYMDKEGNFVIKPQFITALNFQEGRAIVVNAKGDIGILKNQLDNP